MSSGARRPPPVRVRGLDLAWGGRTYVMGILNVTPDSFSGDGLIDLRSPGTDARLADRALEAARVMLAEGADLLDVGGESTRPGHEPVAEHEERDRVVGVVAMLRTALPDVPISIDTTKPSVAAAALDAGADIVNDVRGTVDPGDMADLVAARQVPWIVGQVRRETQDVDGLADVLADLGTALERALAAGCPRAGVILDPGIGFAKTPELNLALLRELRVLDALGQPILVGFSRKSTIGRVLDLPAGERLEGTVATTALAIAGGTDIVRVHDVRANVRAARMADAVVRGWPPPVERR